MLRKGLEKLIEEGFLQKGDKVVIAGGTKVLTDVEDGALNKNNVMGGIIEI